MVPNAIEGRFVQTPTVPANTAGLHGMLNTPENDTIEFHIDGHPRSHSLVGNRWTPDDQLLV